MKNERKDPHYRHQYQDDELRYIQLVEEELNLVIKVLQGNIRILTSLSRYYGQLLKDASFPLAQSCQGPIVITQHEIEDTVDDMSMELSRAEYLVKTIADRKVLVSASRLQELLVDMPIP